MSLWHVLPPSYVPWPCPISCGPVLCPLALSKVPWPRPMSYVPVPWPCLVACASGNFGQSDVHTLRRRVVLRPWALPTPIAIHCSSDRLHCIGCTGSFGGYCIGCTGSCIGCTGISLVLALVAMVLALVALDLALVLALVLALAALILPMILLERCWGHTACQHTQVCK